jgi:hypothetical protein
MNKRVEKINHKANYDSMLDSLNKKPKHSSTFNAVKKQISQEK